MECTKGKPRDNIQCCNYTIVHVCRWVEDEYCQSVPEREEALCGCKSETDDTPNRNKSDAGKSGTEDVDL